MAGGPAINNELTITANSSGAITVTCTLDGFPSVTLNVTRENGQTFNIFSFDPRTVGNGPFSLIDGVGDKAVHMQCTEGTCDGTVQ